MKILASDIGAGTEDLLLYDDKKQRMENCVKMVLPSTSQVYAARVGEATRLYQDLFVKGDTIGGGVLSSAFKKHVEKGLRLVMTEKAAYTIRNVLQEVKELGVEVVSGENPPSDFNGETLNLQEVNLTPLADFLTSVNEDLSDVEVVAVAVQDHGVFPQGTSNRRFRISTMKEILEENPRPEGLAFRGENVPSCFLRMESAVQAVKRQLPETKVLVMDTAPAAILGCLKDPAISETNSVLAINVGNGHTMAAIISEGNIVGVMEHHTRMLNPQSIEKFLVAFADGDLTNREVFNDGGHGMFFMTQPPVFSEIERVAVTGPNRKMLAKTSLPVHFAIPAGDVMMTGPIGLVEATKRKFKLG